jgi:thiamine biosynthesis lipoprotein
MIKKLSLSIILIVLFVGCESSSKINKQFLEGNALGTTYHITFFSEKDIVWEKGFDSIFEAVNKSMSTYLPNSDISKINKGNTRVQVDNMFKDVFLLSKEIYTNTNGYFDPTVGNLVNAYGFGAEQLTNISEEKLDSLFQLVGFHNFKLTANNEVEKKFNNSYIEFNAIAKGYTVDRIASYLEKNKVKNYLIEIGGELRVSGKNKEKNQAWRVGLDDPFQSDKKRKVTAVLELNNQSLATSGNYRKFKIDSLTGERFVHTINPKTGNATKSNILSASVLAHTCAEADAYATAFMAMGLEKSKKVMAETGIGAYLIYAENDSTKIYSSAKFKEQLLKD